GARIMRAVKLYLGQVRLAGGDEAVQCEWRRIWDGYVAFSYTFSILINQIKYVISNPEPETPQDRLEELIANKKPFGQLNHGDKKLGRQYLNDWFDQPKEFLAELVKQGWILPGKPDESPFFHLLKIDGGRRLRQAPAREGGEVAKEAKASKESEHEEGGTRPGEDEAGRMTRVCSDEEIELWRDWVLSLGPGPAQPKAEAKASRAANTVEAFTLGDHTHARLKRVASHRRVGAWLERARKREQLARGRPDK